MSYNHGNEQGHAENYCKNLQEADFEFFDFPNF